MSLKSLAKKLVEVTKKVNKVKKSGFNKHQNYHYSTESDLIDAVRDNLLEAGILLTTSVEEVTTTDTLTIVKMKHVLIDSESGESMSMFSQGFGNLTIGKDKSVFAAQTGSFKYFISKNFLIASEDDPENDSFEDTKKQEPRTFNKPSAPSPIKALITDNGAGGTITNTTVVAIPPSVPKVELKPIVEAPKATTLAPKTFAKRTLNKTSEPNF